MKSHTQAVAVSVGLHSLVLLLAFLVKSTVTPNGIQAVNLVIETQEDEIAELLTLQFDFDETAMDSPDVSAADLVFDSIRDPVIDFDAFALKQSGISTKNGISSKLKTNSSLQDGLAFFSSRVRAVLDASQYSPVGTGDDLKEGRRASSREDIRCALADEIAEINPGRIFSIVFIPMVNDDLRDSLPLSVGLNRGHLLEWAKQHRHDWTETALESIVPTPDLVLLASNARFPMKELRNIIVGPTPMLMVGLKLEHASAGRITANGLTIRDRRAPGASKTNGSVAARSQAKEHGHLTVIARADRARAHTTHPLHRQPHRLTPSFPHRSRRPAQHRRNRLDGCDRKV